MFTIFAFHLIQVEELIEIIQHHHFSDTNDEFYALSKIKFPNSINITDVYKNHIFPEWTG